MVLLQLRIADHDNYTKNPLNIEAASVQSSSVFRV